MTMNYFRLAPLLFLPVASVMAQEPPAFYLQPQSQSVSIGATVTVRSGASGTPPVVYQWRRNNLILSDATNVTLMLTNIQWVQSGEYQIEASNAWGTVVSKAALLDVDPTFTKISLGRIATDGGDSTGVAWGDYDADGFLDLFVSNFGTPFNFLYRNNGDETFTRIASGVVATEDMNAEGAAWADYDNDGDLDLFVSVGLGANDVLYSNDGAGGFTKITNGPPVRSGGNSRGCAWADYDNDGWVDLFVANEQSQNNFLFHNEGLVGFTRITNGVIATDRGNSFGCSWGDYDNDGYPDLFVANNGRPSFLYHNQRDGTFAKIVSGPIVTNVASSASGSWGDYDNDGYLDLFVANLGQRNFLYHNQGDGTYIQITNGPIVEEVSYSWGGAWADFDNDGYLDLFVANGQPNGTGVKDYLFRNAGDGSFTKVVRGSLVNDNAAGDGCAWGDFNNDGFVDLFVSNINGQNNFLYRNNGNSNHWLTVQCKGRVSNASAIGARLELTADINGKSVRQIREISGGGGYGSQNDLRAHFGVGQAAIIPSLRIRWPSGIVQRLANLAVDQLLVVPEPPQLQPVSQPQDGIFRGEFRGGRNLVYEIQVSENLTEWSLLTTLTNRDGLAVFNDVQIRNAAARFYRIKER
ncbi:MAG: hypothetical protein DME26_08115 [Verrucomicrobia bacterium]|nr:MAG: hypothetical protein DME26_08115 [Verrucomicrobiota bacterium]